MSSNSIRKKCILRAVSGRVQMFSITDFDIKLHQILYLCIEKGKICCENWQHIQNLIGTRSTCKSAVEKSVISSFEHFLQSRAKSSNKV
ncbi:hypothetical protein GDO78_003579 [Eleutherodactylus coqui]|uniref:Uncharacterized protein n=1 Tax=Eleutherodactylus coqui TaxID=57060 RepID=A0A8J6EUT8_ELECQ|nr:hypothetical protein GDO78_003579 [Eleutherodactylus coqui]